MAHVPIYKSDLVTSRVEGETTADVRSDTCIVTPELVSRLEPTVRPVEGGSRERPLSLLLSFTFVTPDPFDVHVDVKEDSLR